MMIDQLNKPERKLSKEIIALIHDIRSPFTSLKMRCTYSDGIINNDKEFLLAYIEKISKTLDMATNLDSLTCGISVPLSLLRNYCASSTLILNEDKVEILKYIERIYRIINSLEDLENIKRNNNKINLIESINNIMLEKEMEFLRANIKFLFTKPEGVKTIFIDGQIDNFERMISNLLNNAAEACDDVSGIVSINLDVTDKSVYLVVEDNGRGIPDNILLLLNRGVSFTHGKKNGHGIGLLQIRDTISKLNGKLTIRSEVGYGSKFIIVINNYYT